jgi:hypothetical protein
MKNIFNLKSLIFIISVFSQGSAYASPLNETLNNTTGIIKAIQDFASQITQAKTINLDTKNILNYVQSLEERIEQLNSRFSESQNSPENNSRLIEACLITRELKKTAMQPISSFLNMLYATKKDASKSSTFIPLLIQSLKRSTVVLRKLKITLLLIRSYAPYDNSPDYKNIKMLFTLLPQIDKNYKLITQPPHIDSLEIKDIHKESVTLKKNLNEILYMQSGETSSLETENFCSSNVISAKERQSVISLIFIFKMRLAIKTLNKMQKETVSILYKENLINTDWFKSLNALVINKINYLSWTKKFLTTQIQDHCNEMIDELISEHHEFMQNNFF